MDKSELIRNILSEVNKSIKSGEEFEILEDSDVGKRFGCISTGNMALDRLTGGGIPIARITEVFGDSQTGKSLLVLNLAKSTIEADGIAVIIDTEASYDQDWMMEQGVDRKKCTVLSPDTIEETFQKVEKFVDTARDFDTDSPIFIAVDSIAMLLTEHEKKESIGLLDQGARAKMIRSVLKKILNKVKRKKVALLFVNQTYTGPGGYVPQVHTSGGRGLIFGSSTRIGLKKKSAIEHQISNKINLQIGTTISATVDKNRTSSPFSFCAFDIYVTDRFGQKKGIDPLSGLLDLLILEGKLIQSGAWIKLGDTSFQRGDWPKFFSEHQDILLV